MKNKVAVTLAGVHTHTRIVLEKIDKGEIAFINNIKNRNDRL